MRAVLSVFGLLVTLAMVFWLVKGQLGGSTDSKGASTATRPAQVKEQVITDIKKSMEEQAKKVEDADKPAEKSGAY